MAIETPKPRLKRREKPRGATCLNCREDIETRFCPHCGQENLPADLTLFAALREFFAEIFYYDSKMWRTLRTLLVHPGRLSTEWSQGRRATYLSPIRLYLTITFLFFVVAAWKGSTGLHVNRTLNPEAQKELVQQLQESTLTPLEIDTIQDALKTSKVTPEMQAKIDGALALARKKAQLRANAPLSSHSRLGTNGWFSRQIRKIELAGRDRPRELQGLYVDQFPKVLFIILPLFAVVLKVLYLRQKRYFVEHLVFILHLHSFAFLVFIPMILFSGNFGSAVLLPVVLLLWLPIYGFVAMMRFYKQPWWMTGLKGLVLSTAYLLLLAGGALLGLIFTAYKLDDAPAGTAKSPSPMSATTPPPPGP